MLVWDCVLPILCWQKNGFDGVDLRIRFHWWWNLGYCNAFGFDNERSSKTSVGLGGNISSSMYEFQSLTPSERANAPATKAGDSQTSGNGSVMRNAAVPIYYLHDITLAQEIARKQSQATHQGIEAADCCKLLTFIIVSAINGKTNKSVLEDLTKFDAESSSVRCLARSEAEKNNGVELPDRDWNWKKPDFRYSKSRAKAQPGYIGSYAMDAMAMALHCVWTTDSFEEALLKCANLRGDSDSVCSVTGQIAGAIYGFKKIPFDWVKTVLIWDPHYFIPLRAYKLYHKRPLVYYVGNSNTERNNGETAPKQDGDTEMKNGETETKDEPATNMKVPET